MKYDVFISYRRDGGEYTAKIIRDKLTELGYSVFFDVESLRSGDFNAELYSVIDGCSDFLIILSPNSLDRCINENDWVKNEIEHAIKHNKNIVPVLMRGFTFPDNLPENIRTLPKYNGLEASSQFFDAFIEKLQEFLIAEPAHLSNLIRKPLFKKLCAVAVAAALVAAVAVGIHSNKASQQQFSDYVVSCFTEMGYTENTALQVLADMDPALTDEENLILAFQPLYTDTAEQVYSKMTHLLALGDFDGAHTCVAWWQNKTPVASLDDMSVADTTFSLFLAVDRMAENGIFDGAIVTGFSADGAVNETPLEIGDIIVSVNGEDCVSAEDYHTKRQLAKDFYSQVTVLRPVDEKGNQHLEEIELTLDNSMINPVVKDIVYTG